jgi:hypothetical protein
MYLVEGIKIIFRYAYAILKAHKEFIKSTCTDKALLVEQLRAEARVHPNAVNIHKFAIAWPLKKGRYNLLAASEDMFNPTASVARSQRRMTQEITTDMSTCCTYDEMCQMWEKIPANL